MRKFIRICIQNDAIEQVLFVVGHVETLLWFKVHGTLKHFPGCK